MKITEARTRVVEWQGPTVAPQPHFCTNPMDLLSLPADSMAGFRFHGIVMASLNSPIAEYFPPVDVEVGNELFWYIFDGEPAAAGGVIDLRDDVPGLGLSIKEAALRRFTVLE